MSEGRDLVKEALHDAKRLKQAAVESARNELVENMAPALRKLLDESIGAALGEKRGIRTLNGKAMSGEQRADSRNPANPDKEARVEEELTLEDALSEFFPVGGVKENAMETNEMKKSSKKSSMRETYGASSKKSSMKEAPKSSKKSSMSENIEISEAELHRVYQNALQTEVNVKKGFSDLKDPFVELGGKTPGNATHPPVPETGAKGGEHHWNDETPPHKQSWIPEAKQLHAMLQRGLAENKGLRENLRKASAMIDTLGKKLHEVNLFNAKVFHVNKVLNSSARLSSEQKRFVMDSIDEARSISEVKMVFKTIVGSLKTGSSINESRNNRPPKANAQRPRTSGGASQEVLSESVDRATQNPAFSRAQELAGLIK